MTQQESTPQSPSRSGGSSAVKWVAVVVVVIIIIGGVAIALSYHGGNNNTTPGNNSTGGNGGGNGGGTGGNGGNGGGTGTTTTPLSVAPTISSIGTRAGSPLTFYTGIPTKDQWTKAVWNFGDGTMQTMTSGTGQATHVYKNPGEYLVSLYASNSTGTVSNNMSLIPVTVNPSLTSSIAQIFGPISLVASSSGTNIIGTNGWIELEYQGLSASPSLTVGSSVPGNTAYTIQSFVWNINGGSNTINDNNTQTPETVNLTFSTSGLNTVNLVTTTYDSATGANATGSYMYTVAVGHYNVSSTTSSVAVNKQQLVNAEYHPGGPRTLDPAIAYDTVSIEVITNIYEPLIYFNGTSTSTYHPVIATNVPSVANGEVTANYLNWTFYLNTSATFSNGDHVTPYDVYLSIARVLLFADDPGTPGWILAQALLPAPTVYGPFNESFYWVHHAVTWNNATNSVTFHLMPSMPTWLPNSPAEYGGHSYGKLNQSYQVQNYGSSSFFLQLVSLWIGSVMDYNWLVSNNHASPQRTFPANTSASYDQFQIYGTLADYNSFIMYNAMGTGPYILSLYEPADMITMTVNPHYNQTSTQMPAKADLIPTVILEYLSNEATAQEQFASGYAQLATNAYPPASTPLAQKLISKGVASAVGAKQLSTYYFAFNLNLNVTGAKSYDSATNIWAGFFDNLSIRKAFSYAMNFSYYVNVAENDSGVNFMSQTTGILPPGIEYYPTNISQLAIPYNLKMAEFYFNQSGYNNGTWSFPIFNREGWPAQDEMLSVWENALSQMSGGKIKAVTVDLYPSYIESYHSLGPGESPMPIYSNVWYDDYPNPTDFTAVFLGEYGEYSFNNGLFYNSTITTFSPVLHPQYAAQWANITAMWKDLYQANLETNAANITLLYYKAEKIDVQLCLYTGTVQGLAVVYYNNALNPSGLVPSENPAVGFMWELYFTMTYK